MYRAECGRAVWVPTAAQSRSRLDFNLSGLLLEGADKVVLLFTAVMEDGVLHIAAA